MDLIRKSIYCALICLLTTNGFHLKSVHQNLNDSNIIQPSSDQNETQIFRYTSVSNQTTLDGNLNETLTSIIPTINELNLNVTLSSIITYTEQNISTQPFLTFYSVNETNIKDNSENSTVINETIINTTQPTVTLPKIYEISITFTSTPVTTENALTTAITEELATSQASLMSSTIEQISTESNATVETVNGISSTSLTTPKEEVFTTQISTTIAEKDCSSSSILHTKLEDEEVNQNHIWTKTAVKGSSNDAELINIDLYDDNDDDYPIMPNINDLTRCVQYNNKSGFCMETRKCMKLQPMHTKFRYCGEWPKDSSYPLRVCCGVNNEEIGEELTDDNVYLRDATVNCGEPLSYYNEHQSENLNLTAGFDSAGNKHRNSYHNYRGVNLSRFVRIVNGKNAMLGEIPWIVNMYHYGNAHCGAVIVSRRHIITAAHCFDNDSNPLHYSIRTGELNTFTGKRYRISRCVKHNRYNPDIRLFNDIAMCRLITDIEFTPNVSPICLPNRWMIGKNIVGLSVKISGYGKESYYGESSETLKQTEITVISNTACFKSYGNIPWMRYNARRGFRDNIICAGEWDGSRDACVGDSGGPLAYVHNGRWHLVGVISFGYYCAVPHFPGVYTSVANYLPWIKRYLH